MDKLGNGQMRKNTFGEMGTGRPSRTSQAELLKKIRGEEPEPPSRVIFEVPKSKHRKLKSIAARRGKTVKELMTAHVDQLIKEEGEQ
jgi:hypothetical protein